MKKIKLVFLIIFVLIITCCVFVSCNKDYKEIEVTLVTDGATQDGTTVILNKEKMSLPEPQKEGYEFAGWYVDAEHTIPFDKKSFDTLKSNFLFGALSPIVFNITYEYNGGSIDQENTNPLQYTILDSFELHAPLEKISANPEVEYTFEGWYNNPLFFGESVSAIELGTVGELNFYAKWLPYDIKYFLNGGTNNSNNPNAYEQPLLEDIQLLDPQRVGYMFDGWYDNASFDGNKIISITAGSAQNKAFYAKWVVESFPISYTLNGGTQNSLNPSSYTILSSIQLKNPQKAGYTFDGWYINEDFSGNRVDVIPSGTAGNISLYAKWTATEYTITYTLYGGTNDAMNPHTYTIEQEVVFKLPQKSGYTFLAWFDNANRTILKINTGTTGNIVLYAQWQMNVYSITYELDGATNSSTNPNYYNVEDDIQLSAPSKNGHIFKGWYEDEQFTQAVASLPIENKIENLTLYAKFLTKYNVVFTTNGGSLAFENPYGFTEEDSFDLPEPTKAGYTFEGWYEDEDLIGETTQSVTAGTTNDIELFAKWAAIEYSITYNYDGGTQVSNPDSYTIEDYIVLNSSTKIGYHFKGYKRMDFPGGIPFTVIEISSYGDLQLYAVWEEIEYSIIYHYIDSYSINNNPSFYTINQSVTFSNPTKQNYVFDGWYNNVELTGQPVTEIVLGSIGIVEIYAKFIEEYSIDYVLNGGQNAQNNPRTYTIKDSLTIYNAVKPGSSFKGWYDNNSFLGSPIDSIPLNSTGNRTLYAKFLMNYNISYEIYNGTNSSQNPYVYTEDDAFEFSAPTKSGYEFLGWYTDETFQNPITQVLSGTKQNLSLYASWQIITFPIDYQLDGGINNPLNVSTYTTQDAVTLLEPTKEGYIFKGWYDNQDCVGDTVTSIIQGSVGNKIFYAKFSFMYSIEYLLNEEDGETNSLYNPKVYTSDMTIELQSASKYGYNFIRWENGGQPISLIQGMSQDLTLVPVFEIINYTITYYINGGVSDNPQTYTVNQAITLLPATKTHFTFINWYLDDSFQGQPVTEIVAGSIGEKVFYAKYEPYPYDITYVLNHGKNHIDNPDTYTIYDEVQLKDPEKNEGVFLGWYDNAEFNGVRITAIPYQGQEIGDLTLYANWQSKEYNIIYILFGGVNSPLNNKTIYTSEEQVDIDDSPLNVIKEGYYFDGWYYYDTRGITDEQLIADNVYKVTSLPIGSVGNIVLYARWRSDTYSIAYVLNDGINNNNNPNSYNRDSHITLYSPVREGYTFLGWYDNSQFNGQKITYLPYQSEQEIGNITLYAKFSLTYNIEYVLNGGSFNNEPAIYTIETETITLGEPIKPGSIFVGWYTDQEFTSEVYTQIPKGSTGHKTFVAKFLQEYVITYFLNNGSNSINNPSNFTREDDFDFYPAERTGYLFVGWYDNHLFQGANITRINYGTTSNKTLHAKFLFINYLSYSLSGGQNSAQNPNSFTIEDNITLQPATREGYTFEGWYDNANFLGNPILTVGASSSDLRNLFAKWEVIEYTITYQLNGGLANNNNQTVYTIESAHILLLDSTKANYDFYGWYDNSQFNGSPITTISNGSVGNKIFYAKWQATVYTITYWLNGGTNTTQNPEEYTILSSQITLLNPQKTGATFVNWFDNPALTGYPVSGITAGSFGNRTFYAKWNLENYNIIYHLEEGEINSSINPMTYNVDVEVTLQKAVKGYHTFIGWYENSTFDGDKISVISGRTGELNLYGRFSLTYFINYQLNDGINSQDNLSQFTALSETIVLNAATKDYYNFVGWYSNSEFTGSPVTQITKGTTSSVTLYAKWSPIVYDINYYLNGGQNNTNPTNYNIQSPTINLTAPQKVGYEFDGWYDNEEFSGEVVESIASGSFGVKTVYAKWNLINYHITYNENGGTQTHNNPTQYNIESPSIELHASTKDYYTFEGWYVDEQFSGNAITTIETASVGEKQFYAKWSAIVYSITYHTSEGVTNPELNPNSYTYNDSITFVEPTREFYNFQGWYTNQYFTGDPIQEITNSSVHIDLYPKWKAVEYTITYELDGGINHLDNLRIYTIESNIVLQPATKAGYKFMGWFDIENNRVTQIQNMTGNKYLYAQFSFAYQITYNLDDGTNNINNPSIYTSEENIILLSPNKDGYMFMGWYDNQNFEGQAVTQIYEGSYGSKVFYAKFLHSYKITYYLNGGQNSLLNSSYYLENNSLTLENAVRQGYIFLGWYQDADFAGEPTKIITGQEMNDISLYARWSQWSMYLYHGEYPQTIKAQNVTITEIQDSRGYYLGSDSFYYAKQTATAYGNEYTFSTGEAVNNGTDYYFKVEPIKWRILLTDSGEAMLISEIIIDTMSFHNSYSDITWEYSSLREWLWAGQNGTFMQNAFMDSSEYLLSIQTDSSQNPVHLYDSGASVDDYVTLLSIEDVVPDEQGENAFGFNTGLSIEDENRKAMNSDYVIAKGAYTQLGYGMWWLYTPGSTNKYASYVGADGKVYANGNNVILSGYGVRPVIRLQLS